MSLATYDPPGSMTVYSPDPPPSAEYLAPSEVVFRRLDVEFEYLSTIPDWDYLFDPYDPVTNPEGAIPNGVSAFAPVSDPIMPEPVPPATQATPGPGAVSPFEE